MSGLATFSTGQASGPAPLSPSRLPQWMTA